LRLVSKKNKVIGAKLTKMTEVVVIAVRITVMVCDSFCLLPNKMLKKCSDGAQITSVTRKRIGSLIAELMACATLCDAPITAP